MLRIESIRTALLDAAAERDLALRAHAGDVAARHQLVEHNIALAINLTTRLWRAGVDREDMFQEAALALTTAAAGFDPSFGVRFSTYAVVAITRHLLRFRHVELRRRARTEELDPDTLCYEQHQDLGAALEVAELSQRLNRRERRLLEAWLAGSNHREIAQREGVTHQRITQLFRRIRAKLGRKGCPTL